jgi:hypothetical protein
MVPGRIPGVVLVVRGVSVGRDVRGSEPPWTV